ncbi:MAG: hypothetical protein KY454_07350 [Actinobacteria bacterium]|nr:hypothetical protein [Actinomycetota bacterium]MBW3651487.1 hypothetical protein [Actinomycetota bacterium]
MKILGGFVRAVFSIHDPDELATLLHDAGLVDVAVSVSTVTLRLPAPRDFLWQYINLIRQVCGGQRARAAGMGLSIREVARS